MGITPPKHLEARTPIPSIVVFLERTRTHSTTIQGHIPTDHGQDIPSSTPFPNTPMACYLYLDRVIDRRIRLLTYILPSFLQGVLASEGNPRH